MPRLLPGKGFYSRVTCGIELILPLPCRAPGSSTAHQEKLHQVGCAGHGVVVVEPANLRTELCVQDSSMVRVGLAVLWLGIRAATLPPTRSPSSMPCSRLRGSSKVAAQRAHYPLFKDCGLGSLL